MIQEKCWSKVGHPVIAERSGRRRTRVNLFCGLDLHFEPLAPSLTQENCNAENFEKWFEMKFLQTLRDDAVVIMDNARFHRKAYLFDLIQRFNSWYGTRLSILFLPPYSPDLNPIENYFAVLKGRIKRKAHEGLTVEERLLSVLNI